MFSDNIDKTNDIFHVPERKGDVEGKTYGLGDTSGETLISDGATLDCKEQLGYQTYSQSTSLNPYNAAR